MNSKDLSQSKRFLADGALKFSFASVFRMDVSVQVSLQPVRLGANGTLELFCPWLFAAALLVFLQLRTAAELSLTRAAF